MSERYKSNGPEGNALDYLSAQFKHEWERDYQSFQVTPWQWMGNIDKDLSKIEDRFYRHATKTDALEKAVIAAQKLKERLMIFKDKPSEMDSKDFIKLKDKDFVIGVFRGDVYEFKSHWMKEEKRSYSCTGMGCTYCEKQVKPTFRFKLNFVLKDESGQFVAKIFEGGYKVYGQLAALNRDYPLERAIVKITRNGSDNDTTYTILPMPEWQVSPEREKLISAIKLHDFKVQQPVASGAAQKPEMFDDIPF